VLSGVMEQMSERTVELLGTAQWKSDWYRLKKLSHSCESKE